MKAQSWVKTADGKLTNDVTLNVKLDKVDFKVSGLVTITAADTADNTTIANLLSDIRDALAATQFTVIESDNDAYVVNSSFTLDQKESNTSLTGH